jgi:hypothetical protein
MCVCVCVCVCVRERERERERERVVMHICIERERVVMHICIEKNEQARACAPAHLKREKSPELFLCIYVLRERE